MAVTVETGAVVSGADSYVSRADYIAYALTVGVTITDDTTADIQLVKAAEFIGLHENNLKGLRYSRDQALSYPRSGVMIDGWYWDSDEIPRQVTLCQMALALDLNASIDIYNPPQNPGLVAKRESVDGAVSVEYAVSENAGQKLSRTSTATALLNSLLKNNGLTQVNLIRA